MGNPGTIFIMPRGANANPNELRSNPEAVVLYTHYGGYRMPYALQTAIQKIGLKKARDPEALIGAILADEDEDFEFRPGGYGMFPNVMVDPAKGMIYFEVFWAVHSSWGDWTYEEYANLSKKQLDLLNDAANMVLTENEEREAKRAERPAVSYMDAGAQ